MILVLQLLHDIILTNEVRGVVSRDPRHVLQLGRVLLILVHDVHQLGKGNEVIRSPFLIPAKTNYIVL